MSAPTADGPKCHAMRGSRSAVSARRIQHSFESVVSVCHATTHSRAESWLNAVSCIAPTSFRLFAIVLAHVTKLSQTSRNAGVTARHEHRAMSV